MKGDVMKTGSSAMRTFHEIIERKQADLVRVLQNGNDITIDKSADPMDEIQHAAERDLTIRNVDRLSTLLRDVNASLRRIRDGTFGTCIECEVAISPKRLAALPWAPRCLQCQDAADRDGREIATSSESLVTAA
jgi:RNA polymerase-binding transcription factor